MHAALLMDGAVFDPHSPAHDSVALPWCVLGVALEPTTEHGAMPSGKGGHVMLV